MLCSLLHNFYDPSHTLLPQTMLFSRFTWKALHDLGNIGWDDKIPLEIINLTKLTLYSFFLESSQVMPRYNFSEHPYTQHFLIGLTDASLSFHAYQIYLVSVLHDSEITRVQLLSSSAKTNKTHDRTAPFYELTGVVEILIEIKKLIDYFKSKNLFISPENIRVLTDSECSLIWTRVIKSRFRIGVQTLITKVSLILYDLNLCPFKNLNFINQHEYDFPVDNLTKLHNKETHRRIEIRHDKLRQCSWLNNKTDLLKVINQPWSPAFEATKYLAEADVLPDFEAHLEGGIEELKHSSINTDNVLTLINEISQLSENNVSNKSGCQDDNLSDSHIILTNIAKESDFLNQIYKVYKKLNKKGRHPVGRNGIYHVLG